MLDFHLKQRFSMRMSAIKQAIEQFPGGQAALARLLGVSPQAVNQWVTGVRPVPPKHAIAIEKATGTSRFDLRPDIFGSADTSLESAA